MDLPSSANPTPQKTNKQTKKTKQNKTVLYVVDCHFLTAQQNHWYFMSTTIAAILAKKVALSYDTAANSPLP